MHLRTFSLFLLLRGRYKIIWFHELSWWCKLATVKVYETDVLSEYPSSGWIEECLIAWSSRRALVSNISFYIINHFNVKLVSIGNNITLGKSNASLCDTIRPKYRGIVIVLEVAFVTSQETPLMTDSFVIDICFWNIDFSSQPWQEPPSS